MALIADRHAIEHCAWRYDHVMQIVVFVETAVISEVRDAKAVARVGV